MGDVVMGWMLLWRAAIAAEKLQAGAKKKDRAFYEGQATTARYFINNVLPVTRGKMNAIQGLDDAVMAMPEVGFGGL
jgi:hypothetical protein